MKHCKHIQLIGMMLFLLIFITNDSIAFGSENMETVYYYIVQPGDNLWNISKEIYETGTNWHSLYNVNQNIFDSSLIYPGMKLEILSYGFPEDADERFVTETRKKTKLHWLEHSYVHYYQETPKRHEDYPKETEETALTALNTDSVETWLGTLSSPKILTEKEKEYYRTKDSEDILYSYETERGLPEDIWYLITADDGQGWLIIENLERGKSQEFYRFTIYSDTGEIIWCEKFHGAGGRLYLTEEDDIRIWVMTKKINGEIAGIAGEYQGTIYVGGNFYYEKQNDGTVKENYQTYATFGTGTRDGTYDYPY
ncbi:MAG: LysM peptidoglycan-binding domain-containing protein [Lachnospiraceae bacterium]|nr:LysM peptidoglycan-binding domain-containing protein [Lachnospiraceae bacterium]